MDSMSQDVKTMTREELEIAVGELRLAIMHQSITKQAAPWITKPTEWVLGNPPPVVTSFEIPLGVGKLVK